jgi:N-acetylglucosaminyl-diphospho-decaprenol L-rhamnosyltransferase
VVVVTAHGSRDHLEACLRSLERHPLEAAEMGVHVVDNASRDGTFEMVRDDFHAVELHALPRNVGYAAANNLVLRRLRAPFVLLLNPDTEVGEGALDRLVGVMRERPEVGLAGPRLEKPDGTLDHAAKWTFDPSPGALALGALAHFLRLGRREWLGGALSRYRAPSVDERGAGEVDALSGACALARRVGVDQVGLLDEGYWLYIEDLDWCRRFKLAGWSVWYEGTVTVKHVKGATAGTRPSRGLRANLAFHRGMGRFYRKFYAGRRPLLDALVYLAIGGKLAFAVARSTLARRSLR